MEDDLCKSEDVLNKEYRLYRVSIFKKYFSVMYVQAGGVQDTSEYLGLSGVQHAGGGWPGVQYGKFTNNDGVMRRRGARRLSGEEYPLCVVAHKPVENVRATSNTFESPISKKGVKKICSVAQIVEKFGGGDTHTSEGQICEKIYNFKYKEKVNCTPKRKISMLQDGASLSPSLGTLQLSDQWKPALESPAKKIKLVLFD